MVCSKADSDNQISMHSSADKRASASREIDILTPEGKILKMHLEENTEIGKVKNDCELLCGIPSDLQIIQLQGRDLRNDSTLSDLEILDGCTLKITVPQWWQKFISTCYKGDTQQVRKRIYVKMSQVSREERSFTAAFIAAIKGNHNLMFAAFAGRRINLHSKTKLSGRNLLHAAVSGGSTSCVANILMNGGNALLEAPDKTGETPVRMAEKLYGESGDMVKFLNVYLELHRRDTNHPCSSNRYWDNLGENNNNSVVISVDNEGNNDDENRLHPDDNLITDFRGLNIGQNELSRTNFTETQFFTNKCNESVPSVSKVNIEDYDDKTGHNSLVVNSNGSSKPDERQVRSDNLISITCSEQGNGQTSDTGYYSSGNHSVGKDGTGMFWNEDLFTQKDAPSTDSEITKQELNLEEQIGVNQDESNAHNLSTLSAGQSTDSDSGSGRGSKPRRRAQLRFLEQKRKRSTTERPNLEQLMMMRYDSIDKESHDNGQTEGHKHEGSDKEQTSALRDNDGHAIIACDVGNVCQGEEPVPTVTISSNRDSSDKCPSPKPLRRAQLRKKSIVEQQRRRRSIAQRPNIEGLDIGERNVEGSDHLERNAEDTTAGLLEQKSEGNTTENLKLNPGDTNCGVFGHNPEDIHSDDLERKNSAVKLTQHTEGHKTTEFQEGESSVSAKYVLRLWQDQAHEAEVAALSGNESDTGRSPKVLRRAFIRKKAFMEQRRKKSATEGPDVLKLIKRNMENDDKAGQDTNEIASEDNREDTPSMTGGDLSAATVGPENADSYVPAVMAGKGIPQLPSQLPPSEQTKERIPIRRAQRCSNTSPLLDARAKDTRPHSWSSMSGEESEGSDDEKKMVAEIVAPISGRLAKTQRRRRLPMLPNKRIKLPLIKIEDSGISRTSAAIKVPHPPLGRTRSGSTCSDDSVSSVEMCSERTSESDTVSSPTILKTTGLTKGVPVKHRRKSVPNSPFNFTQYQPIIRSRKNSVQVEEIEEQGFGVSPQLRARLQLRDQPREKLPWNDWKNRIRSGSFPGESDENSAEQFMRHKELQSKNECGPVAWNEKKPRPQTARHGVSRMTFTEWLENKEGSERIRPISAHVRSEEGHKEDIDHERQLHAPKKYEEWLLKKDLEALEQEEKLRRKARRKFQRTHSNK